VRAKVGGAWTPWSEPVHTTHYENSYERIKLTGKLVVGVSSDTSQGIFKFLDGENPVGVDIELVKSIANHLASNLKQEIRIEYIPKNWAKLFEPIENGMADIVIAAVTKLTSREQKYNIRFSDGYFCTGKSLLFSRNSGFSPKSCNNRARKCSASVMRLLNGNLGYGEGTATEELLDKLVTETKKMSFSKRPFSEIEVPIGKLLASNSGIQFAMTDTVFAEARVLEEESDRLASVRLCDCDYPSTYNRLDEYAIAVDQSETELLDAINATIINNKFSGLDKILKDAATKKFPKVAEESPNKLKPLYTSECSDDSAKQPVRTEAHAL
jgi:ABC-type amino acid transport substrate-binding protein